MSHEATGWAVKAMKKKGLKAGPKLVLWELADFHNKKTRIAFPGQDTLADECEMSRSALNDHLVALENAGLIVRYQRRQKSTNKQLSTIYILGLDFEDEQDIVKAVSEKDTRVAVSEKGRIPCPKKADSRVRNSDTNLCKEPIEEPCVADGPTHTKIEEHFEDFFFEAHPRPRDKDRSLELFREAVEAGADPQQIVQAAKSYAQEQKGNEIIFVSYSDHWLKRGRFEDYDPKPEPAPGDPVELWATSIKEKRYIDADRAQKHVEAMLARKLVTESEILQTGKLRLP